MEADFVNEYINRLLANLHDLTSKNVMLETRLAMSEKVIANLQAENIELKKPEKQKKLIEDPTV